MSTISTSGIAPSSVIRAEHILRVINALSNNANNDILITGSLTVTGSTALSGSVRITSVLTLAPNDPLPSGQPTGSIAVSGSGVDCKPYFWNGSTWTSMI